MHFILAPIPISLFLLVPTLLLWPERGLNFKNTFFIGIASIFSLPISVFSMGFFIDLEVNVVVFYLLTSLSITIFLGILLIGKFGSNGLYVGSVKSLLFKKPHHVIFSYLMANILTLALVFALFRSGVFLVIAIIALLVSLFSTIVITSIIEEAKIKNGFIFSAFFFSIGVIYPPLWLPPVLVYILIAPFLLNMFLCLLQRKLI